MAAARLGYLVGQSWLVTDLEAVVLPYHLDAFKQRAGVLSLKYVGDIESRVLDIIDGRNAIESCFAGLEVDTWPSGANFVLFRPRATTGITGSNLASLSANCR